MIFIKYNKCKVCDLNKTYYDIGTIFDKKTELAHSTVLYSQLKKQKWTIIIEYSDYTNVYGNTNIYKISPYSYMHHHTGREQHTGILLYFYTVHVNSKKYNSWHPDSYFLLTLFLQWIRNAKIKTHWWAF